MAIGITDNILPSIPGYEVRTTRDFAMDSVCVSVMEKSSGRQATAVILRHSIESDYPGSIYRAVAECEKKLQLFDPVAETNHVRRLAGLPDGLKYEDEIQNEIGAERSRALRSGRAVNYNNVADRIRKMLMMPGSAAVAYKTSNLFTLAPGQYAKIDDGYPMPQVLPQKQPKPKINQSVTARFGHLDIPEKA